MKIPHTLILLVLTLLALTCGCSTDLTAPTEEELDPIPTPEYGAEFNASPVNLFLPHVNTATLWYNVIGDPENVTIYKGGEFYAASDTVFTAPESGSWDFELQVSYTDTLITRSLTISASEEEIDPGTPVDGMQVIAPNNREAPYDATISLYAWGGTLPYSFEIIVGGEVYTEPTITFRAELPGDYEVIGTITDADGVSKTFEGIIKANAPGELPPLMLDAAGFALGSTAYLEAHGSGGDGNYSYRWFYEGDQFSTDRFTTYDGLPPGEQTFTVYLEDGTENGSTFQDVTVTVAEIVYPPLGVDATVSLLIPTVPVAVSLEAHPDGGDGNYSYQWFYFDDLISTERFTTFYGMEAGGHEFTIVVTDGTGATASSELDIEVIDEGSPPDPLEVNANGTPQGLPAPVDASLTVDIDGGSGDYSIEWVYDGQVFSTVWNPVYYDLGPGEHEFTVFVHDNFTGEDASDSIMIEVLEPEDPSTVSWMVATELKVGPSDLTDTEYVAICQPTNWNRLWLYFKFDTLQHEDTIVEFIYTDGSVRYWTIPDLYPERPAYLMVDAGEALVEEVQQIRLIWTGDGDKCDGWVRLLELHGSYEVPAGYAGVPIAHLESTTYNPSEQ